MKKISLVFISISLLTLSCTKIEEGKNFRLRGIRYYMTNFGFDSVEFDNPNKHRSDLKFFKFTKDFVRVLAVPHPQYQDTVNAFLTPRYENTYVDLPYVVDKRDKSNFTISTEYAVHQFKLVRVEKGRIIIKRVNIPGGLQDEKYVLIDKQEYKGLDD